MEERSGKVTNNTEWTDLGYWNSTRTWVNKKEDIKIEKYKNEEICGISMATANCLPQNSWLSLTLFAEGDHPGMTSKVSIHLFTAIEDSMTDWKPCNALVSMTQTGMNKPLHQHKVLAVWGMSFYTLTGKLINKTST